MPGIRFKSNYEIVTENKDPRSAIISPQFNPTPTFCGDYYWDLHIKIIFITNNFLENLDLSHPELTIQTTSILEKDVASVISEFLSGSSWYYYDLFDNAEKLTQQIELMNERLADDYFNQVLEIDNETTLCWPESLYYLELKNYTLSKFHNQIIKIIIEHTAFDKAFNPDLPGLTLLTNSYISWTKNFLELIHSTRNQKSKIDLIQATLKAIENLRQKEQKRYEEHLDDEGEYVQLIRSYPGEMSILPKYYRIDKSGVKTIDKNHPDLELITNWLKEQIQTIKPKLTVPYLYNSIRLTRETFTQKLSNAFKGRLDIDSLENFISSNFVFYPQNDVIKSAESDNYTIKLIQADSVKDVIDLILELFDSHKIFERNPKRKIALWLYIHFKGSLKYETIEQYVYHYRKK